MGHVRITTYINAGDMEVESGPYFRILFINISGGKQENKERYSGLKIIPRFLCSAV
jgi:hypothetical protein